VTVETYAGRARDERDGGRVGACYDGA
jgi:hypothetical protein